MLPPVPDSQSKACIFREHLTESYTNSTLVYSSWSAHSQPGSPRAQRALTQASHCAPEQTDPETETVAPKITPQAWAAWG